MLPAFAARSAISRSRNVREKVAKAYVTALVVNALGIDRSVLDSKVAKTFREFGADSEFVRRTVSEALRELAERGVIADEYAERIEIRPKMRGRISRELTGGNLYDLLHRDPKRFLADPVGTILSEIGANGRRTIEVRCV